MILYDDKYNFLGMSSDTLSFLGYEDISEFLSEHSDFANLFINKEGYIYKFDNFAWIDFVLYSGSANKKAIVTLKNGQETEISVSIKELFLAKELENSKKLYSVKVISDNFNEISGTPKDASSIRKSIGGFSLGGLVKKEQKEQKESIKEINEFAKVIEENKVAQKNSSNEGFILNIADNELISKDNITQETKEEKNINENFKLNFLNNDTPLEEPAINLLKDDEVTQEIAVDLLKNDEVIKEPAIDLLKNDQTPKEPIIDLLKNEKTVEEPVDLLKSDESIEEPIVNLLKSDESIEEPIVNLLKSDETAKKPVVDLLKSEEIDKEHILDLPKNDEATEDFQFDFPKNISNNEPVLDFLKNNIQREKESSVKNEQEASKEPIMFNLLNDDDSKENNILNFDISDKDSSQKEDLETNKQSNDSNFNFKKAKEPLSFLIDTQDTNETKLDLTLETKEQNLELDFLKIEEKEEIEEKNVTQTPNLDLNFLTKEEETEEQNKNQESLKNKKEIIKQIKKDIKEIDAQPKNEESKLNIPNIQKEEEQKLNFIKEEKKEISETISEDKSFTNTLNNLFNNENQEQNTPSTKKSKDIPNFLNEIKKDDENDIEKLNPLSSLGLNADDEFELMSDFISDTNESIAVMEEFIKTNNLDKINYPLVKIKSSAEILNLDAIIDISNTIREETLNKNSENVINHINTLRERVEFLEKNLTKTVA